MTMTRDSVDDLVRRNFRPRPRYRRATPEDRAIIISSFKAGQAAAQKAISSRPGMDFAKSMKLYFEAHHEMFGYIHSLATEARCAGADYVFARANILEPGLARNARVSSRVSLRNAVFLAHNRARG